MKSKFDQEIVEVAQQVLLEETGETFSGTVLKAIFCENEAFTCKLDELDLHSSEGKQALIKCAVMNLSDRAYTGKINKRLVKEMKLRHDEMLEERIELEEKLKDSPEVIFDTIHDILTEATGLTIYEAIARDVFTDETAILNEVANGEPYDRTLRDWILDTFSQKLLGKWWPSQGELNEVQFFAYLVKLQQAHDKRI